MRIFRPGDILLPQNVDMSLWSVIACDQYTAQPEYWDGVDARVGARPSTLRLILPEAYLETRDSEAETKKINAAMAEYLESGVFETREACFIYVERQVTSGRTRRGLLGLVDLDAYDYSACASSPIRSTEGTVEERLPPRVKVRQGACLELPHVVVFADDPDWTLFEGLDAGETLYDFDLMDGGGRIVGRAVSGAAARAFETALDALCDADYLEKRYALGGAAPVIFAMGDGNHSLATAKLCWEQIKQGVPEAEREGHPARYSLVELVNIHDESIVFEPIHRAIFDTDTARFLSEAQTRVEALSRGGGVSRKLSFLRGTERLDLTLGGYTIGETIALAQAFCVDYVNQYGGKIDYIHDDETAVELCKKDGCCGIMLPAMEKNELFPSIIRSGAFPAKSFSIGPSRDKRYYLECRGIKGN